MSLSSLELRQITRAEVTEHTSGKSAWFVIGNKVYDITKFMDEVCLPFCCEYYRIKLPLCFVDSVFVRCLIECSLSWKVEWWH